MEHGEIEVGDDVFYYESHSAGISMYEDDGSFIFTVYDKTLSLPTLENIIRVYKKGFADGEAYGKTLKMMEIKETLGLL